MKILTPSNHAILDYVSVIIFLIAPSILGLSTVPAALSYTLAIVHLAMTMLTDAPRSVRTVIPY